MKTVGGRGRRVRLDPRADPMPRRAERKQRRQGPRRRRQRPAGQLAGLPSFLEARQQRSVVNFAAEGGFPSVVLRRQPDVRGIGVRKPQPSVGAGERRQTTAAQPKGGLPALATAEPGPGVCRSQQLATPATRRPCRNDGRRRPLVDGRCRRRDAHLRRAFFAARFSRASPAMIVRQTSSATVDKGSV